MSIHGNQRARGAVGERTCADPALLGFVLSLLVACGASQPEPRSSLDMPPDHCAMLHLKRPLAPGEPDADRDCVPDSLDRCINDPEDHDNFDDEDGCPDPDNDRDGVPDGSDRCPLEPGIPSNDGCPAT